MGSVTTSLSELCGIGLPPRGGPVCLSRKYQTAMICCQVQSLTSYGGGCINSGMELQDSSCLPSDCGDSPLPAQSVSEEGVLSGGSFGLPKETLASAAHLVEHQRTEPSVSNTGSTDAGANSPHSPTKSLRLMARVL